MADPWAEPLGSQDGWGAGAATQVRRDARSGPAQPISYSQMFPFPIRGAFPPDAVGARAAATTTTLRRDRAWIAF